jgi:uncharacterized membrane protein
MRLGWERAVPRGLERDRSDAMTTCLSRKTRERGKENEKMEKMKKKNYEFKLSKISHSEHFFIFASNREQFYVFLTCEQFFGVPDPHFRY